MPRGVNQYDEAQLQGLLWTPDLVRPALWLDAADASTVSVATGVSEWRDKSGNGRHFTQTTTANQPAYNQNGINGLSSISFDGTAKALRRTPEAWAIPPLAPQLQGGLILSKAMEGLQFMQQTLGELSRITTGLVWRLTLQIERILSQAYIKTTHWLGCRTETQTAATPAPIRCGRT